MPRFRVLAAVLPFGFAAAAQTLPGGGASLPHRTPVEDGADPAALQAAVDFAIGRAAKQQHRSP